MRWSRGEKQASHHGRPKGVSAGTQKELPQAEREPPANDWTENSRTLQADIQSRESKERLLPQIQFQEMWNPVVPGQLRKPISTHEDWRPCDPGGESAGTYNRGRLPRRTDYMLPDQMAPWKLWDPSDHDNDTQTGSVWPDFSHSGGWRWQRMVHQWHLCIKAYFFFTLLYKTRHKQHFLRSGHAVSSQGMTSCHLSLNLTYV